MDNLRRELITMADDMMDAALEAVREVMCERIKKGQATQRLSEALATSLIEKMRAARGVVLARVAPLLLVIPSALLEVIR